MTSLERKLAEQARTRRLKLLPFPWLFATRKLARMMVERMESLSRIIAGPGR